MTFMIRSFILKEYDNNIPTRRHRSGCVQQGASSHEGLFLPTLSLLKYPNVRSTLTANERRSWSRIVATEWTNIVIDEKNRLGTSTRGAVITRCACDSTCDSLFDSPFDSPFECRQSGRYTGAGPRNCITYIVYWVPIKWRSSINARVLAMKLDKFK